jgi:hypothetical protein
MVPRARPPVQGAGRLGITVSPVGARNQGSGCEPANNGRAWSFKGHWTRADFDGQQSSSGLRESVETLVMHAY